MSKVCKIIQESLDWCEGAPEFAGMQPEVYFTAKANIVQWPTYLEADGEDGNPGAVRSGDFKLRADKSFYKLRVLPDKSQYTSEAQGEYPNVSSLNKLTLVCPGAGPNQSNLARSINNVDCVFIYRDLRGRWRIVGAPNWVGKNTVGQDGGQGPTGTANTTVTVEQTDFTPAPFLHGSFPTEEGDIEAVLTDFVLPDNNG